MSNSDFSMVEVVGVVLGGRWVKLQKFRMKRFIIRVGIALDKIAAFGFSDGGRSKARGKVVFQRGSDGFFVEEEATTTDDFHDVP